MYINRFDKNGKCAQDGNKVEDLFYNLLIKRGQVRKATIGEQRKHIDFILTKEGKEITYDVKALKRINRNDSDTDDSLIWIEWLSVGGNDGWISGKCDFIVFEQKNSFIIIQREKLKELCMKLCDLTSIVKSSSNALYCSYQRYGRKDLLSLIKTSDIIPVADEIVQKI